MSLMAFNRRRREAAALLEKSNAKGFIPVMEQEKTLSEMQKEVTELGKKQPKGKKGK